MNILSRPEITEWTVEKCRAASGNILCFKTHDSNIASSLNQRIIRDLRSIPGMQPHFLSVDYFPVIERQEIADSLNNLREL